MRWAWLLALLPAMGAWGSTDYQLTDGRRWNTVANGPVGGVVVDDDAPVHRSVRAPGARRTAPPWFTMLQKHGLLPANQPLPTTPENRVHRRAGRLVTPDLDRSRQTGTLGDPANRLTFDFTQPAGDTTAVAWSTTQRTALQAYLTSAQTELLRVWGAPAFANTVRVIHDPTLNSLEMAAYDATRNELRIELLNDARTTDTTTTVIDEYDLYVLTHAVLLAYRDDAAIGYDSWEAGMARAAQLTVIANTKPSFGFLARDFNLLFGHYDLLNQPGLESPSFRAADTAATAEVLSDALTSVRAYMSQAAWLKVLAERPTLFADFNAAYYTALRADPSIRFSIPQLRQMMTTLAPDVEGLSFADWYTRQYCLDTSLVPGAKLYIFGTVAKDFISGEPTNSFPMSIYHWETTSTNEARALSGTVRFKYTAFDEFDLNNAVEGASGQGGIQAGIGEAGNSPGIGSAVPLFFNIEGDQGVQMQRIVVDGQLNGMDRRLYFPNDVAASDSQVRYDLYGLVTNGRQGKLKIEIAGRDSVTADVVQGAFRTKIPGGLPTTARATLTWTPDSSGESATDTLRRNVMFLGLLGSGVDVANGEVTLILDTPVETPTRITQTIPAGTSLITIPAFAKRGNLAQILGVPSGDLLLARADGAVTSAQPWRNGNIYRQWPSTPPFQPGYGFFVRTSTPLTLDFQGVPVDRDKPYRLFLAPGWQQFGNPYTDLNITLGSVQVQAPDGTAAVSLADAQTAGLVSSGVFGYTAAGGYSLLSPTAVLTPYQGFWINVIGTKGATLIFPNSLSQSRQRETSRAQTDPRAWQVGLAASTDGVRDTVAAFGVQTGAGAGYTSRDVPKPPPFGKYVSVSFPHEDWGARTGRYARDLRETVSTSTTWDVLVESDEPGRQVTLSWPNIAGAPADLSLVLTDLTTGTQRFMRSTAAYTFTAASTSSRFRVTATRGLGGRLTITSLGVAAVSRSRSGSVNYTLSGPATVTALLYSRGGKLINTLADRRAAARGTGALEFPATDASGRPLPNGVYRLDLVALGEDGQQARASRLVVVER